MAAAGVAVAVALSSQLAAAGETAPDGPNGEVTSTATEPSAESLEPIAALEQAMVDGDADPTDLRGDTAVEVLEETGLLQDVAADAGLEADELVAELLEDPTMFVASTGQVGYVEMFTHAGDEHGNDEDHGDPDHALDEGLALDAMGVADPNAGSIDVLGVPVTQLESNPGASEVLYLDFDGHTTTLSAWTDSPSGQQCWSGVSVPFNGSDAAILDVWERVAEDYSPFDVNVTTRADLDDGFVDQRVVISPTNFLGGCGVASAGNILGVAFLNTFGGVVDGSAGLIEAPAFAFTGQSFASTKSVAETVSHEAGHTFGLRHDGERVGTSVDEYYFGHNGWAPIMGNPVAQGVTQWSQGDYRCANRTEDDIDLITRLVGSRPDDLGSSVAAAPTISVGDRASGIIGPGSASSVDEDVFRMSPGSGSVTVTVRPLGSSPNLHPRLTVRSSSGAVLAAAEPDMPTGDAIVSFSSVSAGTYSIHVEPAAWIGPISGFGVYGSLGAYEVAVDGSFTPRSFTASTGAEAFAPAVGLARTPIC